MTPRTAARRADGVSWTTWLLGPVLAACGPAARLVQFLGANRAEIPRPGVVVGTALAASALLAAATVGWSAWRRRSPIAVGAALGVIGFFFFAADIFGSHPVFRIAAFAVVVGLCALAAASAARRPWVATGAALVGVAYVAVASASYASWRADHRTGLATVHRSEVTPDRTLPNVYFFVLDGYGRDDVLRALYPEDDPGPFNAALIDLGFTIDEEARANYPQTDLSMPSTLDQALILDERASRGQVRQDRSRTMKGANQTVEEFRALGYQYLQSDGRRHDALRCDEDIADGCLGARATGGGVSLGEIERALLELTPFGPAVLDQGVVDSGRDDIWPVDVVDGLIADEWLTQDRPLFVYAHIIGPHPPYVRDARCREIGPVGNLGEGWESVHRPYYLGQVKCLRTQLEQGMRRLLERDPTAIVILQSDHGPGFGVPFDRQLADWTPEMLRTRFGAFRAWRLPAQCVPTDLAASSLVNTFRVVEACVQGSRPELLEPRSYLTRYGSDTVELIPSGLLSPP